MKRGAVIFIAGPTAGGKSAAALALADRVGGEIVNADSMQLYRDLHVLTARPSAKEERRAPHHLYGVLDGGERCSAGRWAMLAKERIDAVAKRGGTAIVVGGTGLYFRSLEEGLSPIPEVPVEVREQAAARHVELGPAAFRAEVIAQDANMARLPEGDRQRLLRAWEVYAGTGKPLSHFQSLPPAPLVRDVVARVVIEPVREALYARCDARAAAMMDDGALDEVRRLLSRGLDSSLPVMKALGVAEVAGYLKGDLSAEAALSLLQRNTRRFAKRQLTWFRNQAADWPRAEGAEAAVDSLCVRLELP